MTSKLLKMSACWKRQRGQMRRRCLRTPASNRRAVGRSISLRGCNHRHFASCSYRGGKLWIGSTGRSCFLEESRSMLYAGSRHQKDITLDIATACCYLSNCAGMLVLSGLVTLNSSAFLTISRQAGFQRASAIHTLGNNNTRTRALLVYRVVRKG